MAQITLNSTGVASSGSLVLQSNGTTTAVTVDTAQNVGVGTSSPAAKLDVAAGSSSTFAKFSSSNADPYFRIQNTSAGGKDWIIYSSGTGSSLPGTFRLFNNTDNLTAFTIDASGNWGVGGNPDSSYKFTVTSSSGSSGAYQWNRGSAQLLAFYSNGTVVGGGWNAANTIQYISKDTVTNRSINAAGTVNASGADYAEYMTKAGSFTIAKGDVIGINAEGKLTNVFADAISFCVKSTDPSYVGGDVWGSAEALGLTSPEQPIKREATENTEAETDEEFAVRKAQYEIDKAAFEAALEAALETARQKVDRIAFAGQVPVNVTGATAGQFIIPVNHNGSIKGQAVSNPTFDQYKIAVGKVIAIEQDGRARIIVKIA